MISLWCLTLALYLCESSGLLCYNCTASNRETLNCGGDFTILQQPFENDRDLLANCSEEGAMCFVRSWTTRARYSWMVQRGCYYSKKEDPIPRVMTIPTRAMACRHERFADAEYKICFCQADWCNSTSQQRRQISIYMIVAIIHTLSNLLYS